MKPRSFLSNLIKFKPFVFNSNKDTQKEDLEKIAAQEQKSFSFETLASATKDFHLNNKLGEGGFGPVYKGKLKDGREIAVKKLSSNSNQGKREFLNEAKLLSRVQHRNVVNLLGYCAHDDEKLLVYEYLPNESLDKFLFNSRRREGLDWEKRFNVITGVARGLLYLHEDSHIPIIHRDIKASNILLDDRWAPKIADFGMARLFPENLSYVNTRVAGTNGYMAPEYVMHGQLSEKADVFSFGVVVLELVSGQKNSTFSADLEAQGLLEWAWKLYKKGRSLEIMDTTMASSAPTEQVAICIQIGLLCTQADPKSRPTMRRVFMMLSKKPGTLEEPTRPGYPGSRYRRARKHGSSSSSTLQSPHKSSLNPIGSSSTGGSSTDSSSHTVASTFNTRSASTSSITCPSPHSRGKRPVQG